MFFALVVCALVVGAPLNADQHQALMETYNSLGAFAKPLFSFSFFFFFFSSRWGWVWSGCPGARCPRFAANATCNATRLGCENGLVTQLLLGSESLVRLTGTLSSWIGQLTGLTLLDLTHNELVGTLVPELGRLTLLRTLGFTDNQLSGTVPSDLGRLSLLQYLWLDDNSLSGTAPYELSGLSSLKEIYVNKNQFASFLADASTWSSILEISFGQNNFSAVLPAGLSVLNRSLELFDGSFGGFSGSIPGELVLLTRLRFLNLEANELDSTIPDFSSLTGLTELRLKANRLVGSLPPLPRSLLSFSAPDNELVGTVPSAYGSLPNIVDIELWGNRLSGTLPNFSSATSLQYLDVSDNAIEGQLPPLPASLTSLVVNDNSALFGPVPLFNAKGPCNLRATCLTCMPRPMSCACNNAGLNCTMFRTSAAMPTLATASGTTTSASDPMTSAAATSVAATTAALAATPSATSAASIALTTAAITTAASSAQSLASVAPAPSAIDGAVVGGAVGGGVAALLLVGALVFFVCRARKSSRSAQSSADLKTMSLGGPNLEYAELPKFNSIGSTSAGSSGGAEYVVIPTQDAQYDHVPTITQQAKEYDTGRIG